MNKKIEVENNINNLQEAIRMIHKNPTSRRIFNVKTKDGLTLKIQVLMPKVKKTKSTWSRFTAKQFFSGYSKTDSIYDAI